MYKNVRNKNKIVGHSKCIAQRLNFVSASFCWIRCDGVGVAAAAAAAAAAAHRGKLVLMFFFVRFLK